MLLRKPYISLTHNSLNSSGFRAIASGLILKRRNRKQPPAWLRMKRRFRTYGTDPFSIESTRGG